MKTETCIERLNRINSFEDACAELKREPALPIVDQLPEKHQQYHIANHKLIILTEAVRGKWEPDFNNWKQNKYYPWFYNSPSAGFGFSHASYAPSIADAAVGSRLCFPDRETTREFGKKFVALYKDLLLTPKN